MPTTPPTVALLPVPPTRTDRANFATRGNDWNGAIPGFSDDIEAVAANVYNNAVEAVVASDAAVLAAGSASASAIVAATSGDATVWVSGTAYAAGVARYSPLTGYIYRSKNSVTSSTDPSLDSANWRLAGSNKLQVIPVTSTSVTAVGGAQYVLTAAGQTTVTLPSNLQIGEMVGVIVANGRTDNRVSSGALPLVVPGETLMNIGDSEAEFALEYVGPVKGWRLVNVSLLGAEASAIAAEPAPQRTILASAVLRALRQFGGGPQVPFPTASPVRQITGTTRYVDPTVVGPGTGTFADPYRLPAPALSASASGDGVLFKAGTTSVALTATLTPAVGGVVIGVYNASTGNRITNRAGAAIINCGSGAFDAISAVNKSDVCVDGLAFINPPPANWCVNLSGTSARGQIVRCTASGGPFHFAIQSSGTGHVIEFNQSAGATQWGILYLMGADDSTTRVNFNKVTTPGIRGIMVCDTVDPGDTPGTRRFSGRIQANYTTDGTPTDGSAGLLMLWASNGAPTITHNYGARGRKGLWWIGTGSSIADWTGTVVESNDFSLCEFPFVNSKVFGDWLVQHNSFTDAGTIDGINPVNADRFSRCMELYGLTFASRVQGGTVRWNYLARAKYHYRAPGDAPGSEGIGVGLDNNTHDVKVYGNYTERNEGQGIQANIGSGNSIFGNWSVDDACSPSVTDWPDDAKCAILHVDNADIYIGNNTIIQTGRAGQLHGVCESGTSASTGGQAVNNIVVGATRSAISRNASTERGNLAIACANRVTSSVTQAVIAADATTLVGLPSDLETGGMFYQPKAGGGADGTGVAPAIGTVSGSGALLFIDTPRGAVHPALA